jgi:hypothetical protein
VRRIAILGASAALGMLASLTGCGAGAVEVPVTTPDPATARLCDRLHDALPGTLHGETGRETRPASAHTAAWGSPAIALRCGVPRPQAMRPTSELVTVNGIAWFPQPPDRPVTFTALGRGAYVEVTVPATYAPPGDVLIELTGAIKAALPAKPAGAL